MWLADLFDDLGDFFAKIDVTFISIGNWFKSYGYSSVLYNFFYTIGGFFVNTASKCYSIADELNDWWDTISQAVSDIGNLGTAINNAIAWVKGIPTELRTYVSGAIDTVKAWVTTQIPDILAWVTSHALDLYNAIKGYIVDIAAWVTSHALDLYNAIKGYITEFVFVVANYIGEIWDALKGFVADAIAVVLAPLAAPINLVNTWFDAIQDFFNDPWVWLEAKFEAWFERFW
jgi:phage-related protein